MDNYRRGEQEAPKLKCVFVHRQQQTYRTSLIVIPDTEIIIKVQINGDQTLISLSIQHKSANPPSDSLTPSSTIAV